MAAEPTTPPAAAAATAAAPGAQASLLGFTLTDIDGRPYPLAQHAGKAVLLVNVASRCGLTPQYAGLEKLHQAYRERGLVVIGVPANDFGAQEPGTEAEIRSFCTLKYQVTFPMMAKVSVKGSGIAPLYRALVDQSGKGDVEWNFAKFLIGRDGRLAARLHPKVTPESDEMKQAVERALGAR